MSFVYYETIKRKLNSVLSVFVHYETINRDLNKRLNLTGEAVGLVAFRGPIHLRVCVSEKGGDGETTGSYVDR